MAFEYVANILKQAFKWFPWQPLFCSNQSLLLSILLDSDQPCNIKGSRFQHCWVMRSSRLPSSPELRGKLAACQAFFQTSKDTPLSWHRLPKGWRSCPCSHWLCYPTAPRNGGFISHLSTLHPPLQDNSCDLWFPIKRESKHSS